MAVWGINTRLEAVSKAESEGDIKPKAQERAFTSRETKEERRCPGATSASKEHQAGAPRQNSSKLCVTPSALLDNSNKLAVLIKAVS